MCLAASADDWSGTPVQTEAGAGGAQGGPEEGRQNKKDLGQVGNHLGSPLPVSI